MSSIAFKDMARPLLEESDAAIFDLLDLDMVAREDPSIEEGGPAYIADVQASGSDFMDGWRQWERALRLNLARHRAQRVKRENAPAAMEAPAFPMDAASAALKAVAISDSPLKAETILDKARWDAIEALQGSDYFDRNTIFAFLLKLMLLERSASFKVEEGFTEYKKLYASILEGVDLGVPPEGEPK
jgi:hypothetical protein